MALLAGTMSVQGDEEMDPAEKPARGRKPGGGRSAPLTREDMLRLQLTCNSLEAMIQATPEVSGTGDQSLARFLRGDLLSLLRRAERQYRAALEQDGDSSPVKLDLLREDQKRLRRLARAAAKAVDALSQEGDMDADARNVHEADIRRYLAAQRHQLAWYRDNLS